ncbi:hypothetical protein D3C75_1058930 [compost metagenome]
MLLGRSSAAYPFYRSSHNLVLIHITRYRVGHFLRGSRCLHCFIFDTRDHVPQLCGHLREFPVQLSKVIGPFCAQTDMQIAGAHLINRLEQFFNGSKRPPGQPILNSQHNDQRNQQHYK